MVIFGGWPYAGARYGMLLELARVMGTPTPAARAALLIITYVVVAALSLLAINRGVPPAVEQVLSVIAFPLFFIFVPLYPLFARLGLMAGELWRLPSAMGLVLGTLLYAAIAYGAVSAFSTMRRR